MGHLTLDKANNRAILAGQALELNAPEFDILWLLASQPGRIFSREDIVVAMTTNHPYVDVSPLPEYISRLHTQLGKGYIRLVGGAYQFLHRA